jgi:hypothetical protein
MFKQVWGRWALVIALWFFLEPCTLRLETYPSPRPFWVPNGAIFLNPAKPAFGFRTSDFEFVSGFGFRISDFLPSRLVTDNHTSAHEDSLASDP